MSGLKRFAVLFLFVAAVTGAQSVAMEGDEVFLEPLTVGYVKQSDMIETLDWAMTTTPSEKNDPQKMAYFSAMSRVKLRDMTRAKIIEVDGFPLGGSLRDGEWVPVYRIMVIGGPYHGLRVWIYGFNVKE